MREQRAGRFSISHKLIEQRPDDVRRLLAGLIVVRAESLYWSGAIEYTALGDAFEPVPEGSLPAYYSLQFVDGAPSFFVLTDPR